MIKLRLGQPHTGDPGQTFSFWFSRLAYFSQNDTQIPHYPGNTHSNTFYNHHGNRGNVVTIVTIVTTVHTVTIVAVRLITNANGPMVTNVTMVNIVIKVNDVTMLDMVTMVTMVTNTKRSSATRPSGKVPLQHPHRRSIISTAF